MTDEQHMLISGYMGNPNNADVIAALVRLTNEAVQAEREACAKVCEIEGRYSRADAHYKAEMCAYLIRARTPKNNTQCK